MTWLVPIPTFHGECFEVGGGQEDERRREEREGVTSHTERPQTFCHVGPHPRQGPGQEGLEGDGAAREDDRGRAVVESPEGGGGGRTQAEGAQLAGRGVERLSRARQGGVVQL